MLTTLLAADPMPEAVTKPFDTLLGWVMWMLCAAAVGRLIVIGAQMGHAHSHPAADPPDTPLGVFVGLIIGASAAGIAGAVLTF